MTECSSELLSFQGLGGKRVVGAFDGKKLSSEGGALLLRELSERHRFFEQLAECFVDHRSPAHVHHSVETLLTQRIFGLMLGYEDLNDHDQLRVDPVLQLVAGKLPNENGTLASHSTLNRLELCPDKSQVAASARYHRIVCEDKKIEAFFLNQFIAYAKNTGITEFILDADATDVPLHGKQQESHYHGYYGHHCYLPLYIFCNDFPLLAKLRPSNIDASLGTTEALREILKVLREHFPSARIIFRADSGFCRDEIMQFCEENGVEFIIGLARNNRLQQEIAQEMAEAKAKFEETTQPARYFKDFSYQTVSSWTNTRRVVGKAEYLAKGENPRFVVTSLSSGEYPADRLYEKLYCLRGDAENRIKEQFQLFAGRTSCSLKRANQLRLWFSTLAYLLMTLAKKYLFKGTEAETMEVATLRVKLLKLAVQVKVSARRIYLSFAESFPLQALFRSAAAASP